MTENSGEIKEVATSLSLILPCWPELPNIPVIIDQQQAKHPFWFAATSFLLPCNCDYRRREGTPTRVDGEKANAPPSSRFDDEKHHRCPPVAVLPSSFLIKHLWFSLSIEYHYRVLRYNCYRRRRWRGRRRLAAPNSHRVLWTIGASWFPEFNEVHLLRSAFDLFFFPLVAVAGDERMTAVGRRSGVANPGRCCVPSVPIRRPKKKK